MNMHLNELMLHFIFFGFVYNKSYFHIKCSLGYIGHAISYHNSVPNFQSSQGGSTVSWKITSRNVQTKTSRAALQFQKLSNACLSLFHIL